MLLSPFPTPPTSPGLTPVEHPAMPTASLGGMRPALLVMVALSTVVPAVLAARHRRRHRVGGRRRLGGRSSSGQATAEYALVLLGAAAIALMLTAWAAKSGAIGRLFDAVVEQLIDEVG